MWGINLRALLPKLDWDRLRKRCYNDAGRRCQVCGSRGPEWPVDCNEQWGFVENAVAPGHGVQKLHRLAALCPPCHSVKHLGKANVDGRYQQALAQLSLVNGWSQEESRRRADQAFDDWERRSEMRWTLDLSILPALGVAKLAQPPAELGEVRIVGVEIEQYRS